jgi:chemotaxis protein CheC
LMSAQYNDVQLDALRELANIGAGTASTALSEMLGRSIDLAVPDARVLPMADAVDQLGAPEQEITGIMLGVEGELPATVLMLLTPENAEKICVMLGLPPESELAPSALGEIGNVVGTSYLNALAGMTGIEVEPTPPATVTDMLGAIVESILAVRAASSDRTLLLDSSLVVEGEDCSIVFLLVPDHGGAEELLERIGLS